MFCWKVCGPPWDSAINLYPIIENRVHLPPPPELPSTRAGAPRRRRRGEKLDAGCWFGFSALTRLILLQITSYFIKLTCFSSNLHVVIPQQSICFCFFFSSFNCQRGNKLPCTALTRSVKRWCRRRNNLLMCFFPASSCCWQGSKLSTFSLRRQKEQFNRYRSIKSAPFLFL